MEFSRQEYWSGLPLPSPGYISIYPLLLDLLPIYVPAEHWVEFPLRYSRFSLVAQSCPTLCDPKDCSLSVSSIHGISQARILEWVAISFSKGSSRLRNPGIPHCRQILYLWATREAQILINYLFYTRSREQIHGCQGGEGWAEVGDSEGHIDITDTMCKM